MDSSHWPLILIEGVLVFGGALAFGWWQLRSVKRDQEAARRAREAETSAEASGAGAEGTTREPVKRDGAS